MSAGFVVCPIGRSSGCRLRWRSRRAAIQSSKAAHAPRRGARAVLAVEAPAPTSMRLAACAHWSGWGPASRGAAVGFQDLWSFLTQDITLVRPRGASQPPCPAVCRRVSGCLGELRRPGAASPQADKLMTARDDPMANQPDRRLDRRRVRCRRFSCVAADFGN